MVVAIDVTGKPKPLVNGRASNIELAVGSILIMFNQLAETRRALSLPDIYIKPAVNGFGVGDFFQVKEILDATVASKDTLKRLLERQVNATLIGGS
jgi:NTE family protein